MRVLPVLGAAAVLAACAGVGVKQDYDTAADFARLRTYAWKSPQSQQGGDKASAASSLMDSRIRNAVDAELARKGFRRVEGAPDFIVERDYAVERRAGPQTSVGTGVGLGTGYGGGFGSVSLGIGTQGQNYYDQETLTIDVMNPVDGALLWRGSSSREMPAQSNPQKITNRMNDTVRGILAKFPPKTKL